MDVSTSSCESLATKAAKRKFMQWALKWYYANMSDDRQDKPDVTTLTCLLQSIGFHLRHFEKAPHVDSKKSEENKVTVTIECGSSKMQAVLVMDNVKCCCPDPAHTNNAEFWSVCGTEPTGSMDNIYKFEETGSNLLPILCKDTHRMINDVIHRLLKIINKTDVNDEDLNVSTFDGTDQEKPKDVFDSTITRGKTQPEIISSYRRQSNVEYQSPMSKNLSSCNKRLSISSQSIPSIIKTQPSVEKKSLPVLLRQKTWDLETKSVDGEPRPSPPKISSSPVILTDLCSSLGQVSLQSEEEPATIAGCLVRARFYIEKAQLLDRGFSPAESPRSSNHSDRGSVFLKPTLSSTRPKLNSRGSPCFTPTAALSPDGLSRKPLITPKSILRRSVGSPLATSKSSTSPTIRRSPLTQPPVRRKTIGEPSPTLKLAVAGAQRKVMAKVDSNRRSVASTISSSSSIIANETRTVLSARKRVTPEIKTSPHVLTGAPAVKHPTTPKLPNPTQKLTTANSFVKKSTTKELAKNFGYIKK